MKITRLSGPDVRLELSANDWQLYGLEGRDRAAAELNTGMEERIKNAPTRLDFQLGDLLHQFSAYGASDTEGFWTVQDILDKVYGKADY